MENIEGLSKFESDAVRLFLQSAVFMREAENLANKALRLTHKRGHAKEAGTACFSWLFQQSVGVCSSSVIMATLLDIRQRAPAGEERMSIWAAMADEIAMLQISAKRSEEIARTWSESAKALEVMGAANAWASVAHGATMAGNLVDAFRSAACILSRGEKP